MAAVLVFPLSSDLLMIIPQQMHPSIHLFVHGYVHLSIPYVTLSHLLDWILLW